jgi:hypothetical protein
MTAAPRTAFRVPCPALVLALLLAAAIAGRAAGAEDIIVWGEIGQNQLRYRTWSGSAWSAESTLPTFGGDPRWVVCANCPTRFEAVCGGLDAGLDVNLSFFDGSSWGAVTELTTDTEVVTERPFHMAYEQSSGDLLIAYWSKATDEVGYRTWNGTTLSGQSTLTLPSNKKLRFLTLTPKPGSDEVMLVCLNDDKEVHAAPWSGSSWGSVTEIENDTDRTAEEIFSMAYETQSGDGLIVYGEKGVNGPRYRTWDGASWSAVGSVPTTGAPARYMRLVSDLRSDEILIANLDNDKDLDVNVWSGSAWGTTLQAENDVKDINRRYFDIEYERGGNEAIVAYMQNGSNTVMYRTWDGSSWSAEQTGPDVGNEPRVIQTRAGVNSGEVFIAVRDAGDDLEVFKWSGSAMSSVTQVETTMPGTDDHEAMMFAFPTVKFTLADHANGQEPDAFTLSGSETNAELFGFELTPYGGTGTVTQLVLRLSASSGLVNGDWAGIELLVDANGDGAIGGGETTAVGGTGVVDHAAGTITFSTAFSLSAATNYILRADFASLATNDTVTIGLDPADLTSVSLVTGSTTPATHSEASFTADVLFVVSNATTLTAQDAAKKTLMEGWGYRVVPIAATATQAQLDAIVPTMDVAYVSEEITDTDLNTKIKSKSIAVILEEAGLADDFGFSSSTSSYNDTAIDVTDNGHFVTELFAAGSLTTTASSQPLTVLSGTAGGYTTLAERLSTSAATLAYLEPGASLYGGGTAAGRRVFLPWGGSAFDVTTLAMHGERLMERAIQWGHGPIAHWKLNDGSGVTAVDSRGNNDGTVASGTWTTGHVGGGLSLNGTTDYVTIADSATLRPTTALTIAAWVKGDAWGSGTDVDTILRKGDTNPNNWQLAIAGGKVSLMLDENDDAGHVGTTTLSTGTWYHVAATWDGAKVRIYVNAVLDNAPAAHASPIGTDTRAVYLGGRSGADLFDGIIDDVRFYNYALSAKEIAAIMAPSTAGNALLVVGSPSSLTAQESLRKAQLEAWEYEVTLIDESDTQANFDAAVALNDVAYVPEDVSASTLSTKLVGAPIGVVVEHGDSYDDFGVTTGSAGSQSATQIDVLSNDHWITEPFSTGNLTICSSSQPMNSVSASLARGAQVLAEWPSSSSGALIVVEAAARLSGGDRAEGRRVFLPVGDSAFQWGALAEDGLTIVQRSLSWSQGLVFHYRLDETSGTTAADSLGGYDATLTSMDPPNDWVDGAIDNGLDFDGSNDRAVTTATFTPPTTGTLAFWMKVPGSPAAQGVILGTEDVWEVRHVTTGTTDGVAYGLVFDLAKTGANSAFVTTTTVDEADRWYHVVAAYDATAGTYAVYLDGALHKSGTTTFTTPAGAALSIGTRTGAATYFVGTLDDIRFMDYVVGADEALALYDMCNPVIVQWQETDPD